MSLLPEREREREREGGRAPWTVSESASSPTARRAPPDGGGGGGGGGSDQTGLGGLGWFGAACVRACVRACSWTVCVAARGYVEALPAAGATRPGRHGNTFPVLPAAGRGMLPSIACLVRGPVSLSRRSRVALSSPSRCHPAHALPSGLCSPRMSLRAVSAGIRVRGGTPRGMHRGMLPPSRRRHTPPASSFSTQVNP